MIKQKWVVFLFLGIELTLYILYNFYTSGIQTSTCQYASIVVAFIWVMVTPISQKSDQLVRAALLCTLVADYFLVIRGSDQVIAMIWFNMVQILYALRIYLLTSKKLPWRLALRGSAIIILLLVGWIITKNQFDLLLILTLVYFANLVLNMMEALFVARRLIFGLGLLLFIGCDIFVGLGNIQDYLTLSPTSIWAQLLNLPFDLAWAFYLPSQVLIALSINKKTTS